MLLKFTIFKKLLEYSLIFCQTEIFVHITVSIGNLKVRTNLYRRLSNKWLFVAIIVKLNMFNGIAVITSYILKFCSDTFMLGVLIF